MLDRAGRDRLPAAIELVETAGAAVQENVFGGMETAVRADAASSFQEEGNSMEPCPVGGVRYLAPDEASPPGHLRQPDCR